MEYRDWGYEHALLPHTAAYILPAMLDLMSDFPAGSRLLDVGCGNGSMTAQYAARGFRAVGIDLSEKGIQMARQAHAGTRFEIVPADANVLDHLKEDPFDLVASSEVVEHLYDPRAYAAGCFTALRPGGRFVCSTPYHGYLKNLLIALRGKWDSHADPLHDGGHIKFFSRQTLSRLLKETGFVDLRFRGAGRAPYLWMSMVMSGDRPMK